MSCCESKFWSLFLCTMRNKNCLLVRHPGMLVLNTQRGACLWSELVLLFLCCIPDSEVYLEVQSIVPKQYY